MRTRLTPDVIERVCRSVRGGVPFPDVLAAHGIPRGTAWRWLRIGGERPASIYGTFREQILVARAEADVVDIQILSRAKSLSSKRVTTVTRHDVRIVDGERVLIPIEQTVTTVEIPPDPRWAAWMLERRGRGFPSADGIGVGAGTVPEEVTARTIAERLRIIQGGDANDRAASMSREGDVEGRSLLNGG